MQSNHGTKDLTHYAIHVGVQVISPDGVTHNSRAMLLLSSCELPVKSLVSNMKAYNGKYGCTICEDTGEGSSNPLHRIWPFRVQLMLLGQSREGSSEFKLLKNTAYMYSISCAMTDQCEPLITASKRCRLHGCVCTDVNP